MTHVPEHEIEAIVRRVLGRMMASSIDVRLSDAQATAGTWNLSDRIVTLASLQALPPATRTLQLGRRAVITPAAKDWLRERGVTLVYGDAEAHGKSPSNPQATDSQEAAPANRPLWVGGSGQVLDPSTLADLVRRLAAGTISVRPPRPTDAESLTDMQSTLSALPSPDSQACLLVVESPLQLVWTESTARWRPVVIRQASDIEEARSESNPNLWLVRGPVETHRLIHLIRHVLRSPSSSGRVVTHNRRAK